MKLYAVRNKETGKLVTRLTGPSHKFWERKADCENAVRRANKTARFSGFDSLSFEMVTFELVEVKEDKNERN